MEVEDHNNPLASFDVFDSFQISVINHQCSFHIGNHPLPGKLFDISVHNANGFHFDAHIEMLSLLRRS
jgi:hypothetical protein